VSDPVAAIVLAAGESRRMGTSKALLDFGGETALARVVRVLGAVPVARTIVVLPPPHSMAMPRAFDREGVTTVVNVDPSRGQTSSIRVGLASLGGAARAFLLCPVDVPLFEAADVRALLEARSAARSASSAARIFVPSHAGRRGHPVLFDRALAAEFAALGDGEPGHAVLRRDESRVVHVARDNPFLVKDIDTPEDYRAACSWLASRTCPT
jgi:molybdenum cofactor cytidylyltransferase